MLDNQNKIDALHELIIAFMVYVTICLLFSKENGLSLAEPLIILAIIIPIIIGFTALSWFTMIYIF